MEKHKLRVFENMVLRRIFVPKRDEVAEGWSKLHNEELHNPFSPPCIIRIIKPTRIRWEEHVARMGRRGMHMGFRWENQKESNHYEDQDVDGRLI
jgi:hypothetical protein